MDMSPSGLDSFFYGIDARFNDYFARTAVWWDKLATLMPSTSESERHWWAAQIPRFREWTGERVLQNIAQHYVEIPNKDWELTVSIPRNKLKDDKVGALIQSVQQMGERGKKLPDDVLSKVIQAGNTTPCWDGQNFFDTSHPVKFGDATQGTYSNNFLSTPLTPTNFATVRQAMVATMGEDGKPLEVMPNLLVIPPQLEIQARQIISASLLAPSGAFGVNAAGGMQSNVLMSMADILIVKEFSNDPNTWYMVDTSHGILPFIWQEREPVKFQNLTADSDANVFWRKEFVYGADGRGNAGFGMPFIMARATANVS